MDRRAMGGDVMSRGCSALRAAMIDDRADTEWPSPSSAIKGSKNNDRCNNRHIEVSRLPDPIAP
jgi:hypothetical protein